nr:MAG TPA: hypothetical protein [Caudoviricetes sp.]
MNPTDVFPLSGFVSCADKPRVFGAYNNHVYVSNPHQGKVQIQVVADGCVSTATLDADAVHALANRLSAMTQIVTKREFV